VTVSSQSLTGTESDSVPLIENENPPIKKRNCMKTVQAGKEGPDCSNACRVMSYSFQKTWSQFPLLYAGIISRRFGI
jgi:hypothetical protein